MSGPLFTLCSQAKSGYNTYCQINSTRLSLPNFRIHGVRMGNRSLELQRRWAAGERTLVDTRACHRGIIFAFFGHFLHSLFSLLIHFYAFPVMFYAYSLRIFDLPMTKNPYLILSCLSYRFNSTLPSFLYFSLFFGSTHTMSRRAIRIGRGLQGNYPQRGIGEVWVSTRPSISSSSKS